MAGSVTAPLTYRWGLWAISPGNRKRSAAVTVTHIRHLRTSAAFPWGRAESRECQGPRQVLRAANDDAVADVDAGVVS